MLYIIVPIHNRKQITLKFIQNLLEQSFQNFHVVLIDDGSVDNSSEEVKQLLGTKVTIIYGDGNLWWAGSLQVAKNHLEDSGIADDELILIMNDDTKFNSNLLEVAINLKDSLDNAIVQAIAIREDNSKDMGHKADWGTFSFMPILDNEKVEVFSTRGLLMKKRTLMLIGNFYPRLIPHYLSDYEYTYRAYKKGIKLITNKDFYLYSMSESSGIHKPNHKNIIVYLRNVFTKRSASNPIYSSLFVVVAAPVKFWVHCLVRIWYGFIKNLLISIKL